MQRMLRLWMTRAWATIDSQSCSSRHWFGSVLLSPFVSQFIDSLFCIYKPLYLNSVAPMMDCTDKHYRTLARLISKKGVALHRIVYQTGNLVKFCCMDCGCLNPRVAGHGCFGVLSCLIRKLYAASMCIIAANTNLPVSVKCRIGLDDHDSYNELCKLFKLSFPHRK
ncbi:hypothetical protein MTR67_004193 [Solanum verrucosum]|uniref:Uncharacterized protein n=1 Tax=Solanum verrucosum TaxID=315347 RepID=A0AAF0TB50_SOLVR|nr:hypothetical protein MTR67_004193 [Solanum verrucosum]